MGPLIATLETREEETPSWFEVAALVRSAQDGDRDAFGRLVEQFEPTVRAIALRRLGNVGEALELTQEVFLHVMRRLGQLREPERFAGWLRQVAVRMAINHVTRRPSPFTVETAVLEGAFEQADEPIDALITRERAERLWEALGRLKTLDRDTLVAFYIRDLSLIEMAEELDVPLGTIKRRLHTARKRLRVELESSSPDEEWAERLDFQEDPDEEDAHCLAASSARSW
ncbi:RNA polymerase sigma factor [Planctomyces sp. SH-PL62]|uniref:RNA polymerase sigma factor n=1 Tax=Planctomyces sp. SH-PL62 TaxID=1636152 RepID=UPI00078EBADF|nr:sigma-70 family RNA polymerase sigma factor [Planctomyces sp. SH-PL62]AMV39970.1 ECF RNA polymerase sigma factor SigW [Planctomyces sp. SH-PL62]